MSRATFAQFPLTYKTIGSNDCYPFRIENAYDSGILLTGGHDTTAEIIKMDANGKKLWIRNFKSKVETEYISFKQANDGGYYVFGISYLYDASGDGFICKLNTCGESQWGQIFKIPELNWVNDVFELGSKKLLITQCGNSFRTGEFLYSTVGIYDILSQKYTKQFLIPTEPLYKKTVTYNHLFYDFYTWNFQDKIDNTLYRLGSSQVAFDSTLSNFTIQYLKPFELPNTYPLIIAQPVFLMSGSILSGGSLVGLRTDIGYQMAFTKYNKDLENIAYKDMGHVRGGNGREFVEFLHMVENDKFISLVNYEPEGDYSLTKNSQAELYLIDTNFNELKKITYGDTINYKYYIYDFIEIYDKNILVLFHKFKSYYNIAYELAKFDKNLNLVTTAVPPKSYDYKCVGTIDTFGYIDLLSFDTLTMTNWNNIAHSSWLTAINSNETNIQLYPNPTNGEINLQFKTPEYGELTIYNAISQILFQTKFSEKDRLELILPDSIKGLVYLKIETQNLTIIRTVIVN